MTYTVRPDGKKTLNQIIDRADIAKLEAALCDVLKTGWGTVEIVVERHQVTGLRVMTSQSLSKFKNE